jgi:hypothetical protein
LSPAVLRLVLTLVDLVLGDVDVEDPAGDVVVGASAPALEDVDAPRIDGIG